MPRPSSRVCDRLAVAVGRYLDVWEAAATAADFATVTQELQNAYDVYQFEREHGPSREGTATLPTSDNFRLTGQRAAILARLQEGPAQNVELKEIALCYTARIAELRHRGYDIRNQSLGDGITLFSLYEA